MTRRKPLGCRGEIGLRARTREAPSQTGAGRTRAGKALLACLAAALAGCGSSDSSDIRTGGVRATIVAEAKGNGRTEVTAVFTVGSGGAFPTQLDLGPGDSATVTSQGVRLAMKKNRDPLGGIRYEATFDFDAEGTLFTVALERASDTSAPNTSVRLPSPFTISAPSAGDRVTSDGTLTVLWSPSGFAPKMDLKFTTQCNSTFTTAVVFRQGADTGAYSVPVRSVTARAEDGSPPGATCDMEIELTRMQTGQLDPAYGEGGSVVGVQRRKASVLIDIP